MSFKTWIVQKLFGVTDASTSGTRDLEKQVVKRLGLRLGDVSSKDFEPPEFELSPVTDAYNTDGYVRQGIDKYIDQMFKEGSSFVGKNENTVEYIKLRLSYMAECTQTPLEQFLVDIAEDVVKYSNCIIAKARMKEQAQLPPSVTVQGLMGQEPIVGYFCLNPTTLKVKRDKNGTVQGWQQEVDGADKPVKLKKEDVVHIYYKREKGNAFGTPFMLPVLDDVRALRQAEENILKAMYRNIHPFFHAKVGSDDEPCTEDELEEFQAQVEGMQVDGGIATSHRVEIKALASDQVLNAEPYLKYFEARVFSGMGIPAIMFGRGDTANRSTGDNMTSEMADRIKAIQKTIEMFFNEFIIKELLMEGGFDPILNPDDKVELRFNENDIDMKIKTETHAVYLYEHNAITEDEMRLALGRDPITDRGLMYVNLITIATANATAEAKAANSSTGTAGTKETNNKQKPTNQHGTKTSPKKTTNSDDTVSILLDNTASIRYSINNIVRKNRDSFIKDNIKDELFTTIIKEFSDVAKMFNNDRYIENTYKQNIERCLYVLDDVESLDRVHEMLNIVVDLFEDSLKNIIMEGGSLLDY